MREDEFWRLVERARDQAGGDIRQQGRIIEAELVKLPREEVLSFDQWLEHASSRSFTWPLWGAAYQLHGGCGDDDFDYFRYWLIAQGRETFENVCRDPDSLADVLRPGRVGPLHRLDGQEIAAAVVRAHVKAFGSDPPPPGEPRPLDPAGKQWAEADLPRLFPKLTARRGGDEGEGGQ